LFLNNIVSRTCKREEGWWGHECACCWNKLKLFFNIICKPDAKEQIFLNLNDFIKQFFCFLPGEENELVSGSSDKLVIVWKKTGSQDFRVSYNTCVYHVIKHFC